MARQAQISFGNVKQAAIIGASITFSGGIDPSTFTLQTIPTMIPGNPARLTIRLDDTITFENCLPIDATISIGSSGFIQTTTIKDRRWKWRFYRIRGHFNQRKADGTIDEDTGMSPQDMAKRLLRAMEETNFDVSQLPNEPRPEILWDQSNPAEELAELVEALGCRVFLGTDNKVRILKVGVGRNLPVKRAMNAGIGAAGEAKPSAITVVTAPIEFQDKFLLEAVGLMPDGKSIEVIDKLPYKPDGGWGQWVPGSSLDNEKTYTVDGEEITASGLAIQSVFKWYRAKSLLGGKFQPPGLSPAPVDGLVNRVTSMAGLLPLRPDLLETEKNHEGVEVPKRAYCEGIWYEGGEVAENTPIGTPIKYGFSLDQDAGIVKFDDYVYKIEGEGDASAHKEADITLTCSFSAKPHKAIPPLRTIVTQAVPSAGGMNSGALVIHRPEIFPIVIQRYTGARRKGKIIWNRKAVIREAEHYIEPLLFQFSHLDHTADVTIEGIVNISPDGAVQQVTWTAGNNAAAITRATRNQMNRLLGLDWDEHRRIQKVRRADRLAKAKLKK